MRRIQMILTGIFLGGVLLGGVGTGIAMVEYSSLTYGGKHIIGKESLVTRQFDFEFNPDNGNLIFDDELYLGGMFVTAIEADKEVPADVVRCEVTYNEKRAKPFVRFHENEKTEEDQEETAVSQGELRITARYEGSDLAVFMENKDRFLEELKNRVISDYEVLYITDITVKVNPETLPFVELKSNVR